MMCPSHHIGVAGTLDPLELLGLERLPVDLRSEEALARLADDLAGAQLRWDLLGMHLRFDPASYCRTVLLRSTVSELVLVGWLPGQRSPIHDHGHSSGVVRLLFGDLVETLLQPLRGRLERIRAQSFGPGDVMVERPGVIHQVHNASSLAAATLHLYFPPLDRMTRYRDPSHHPSGEIPAPTEELDPPADHSFPA